MGAHEKLAPGVDCWAKVGEVGDPGAYKETGDGEPDIGKLSAGGDEEGVLPNEKVGAGCALADEAGGQLKPGTTH